MIEILQAGLYSSVQDLGRSRQRNLGVPSSGVMDVISASLSNSLVNNDSTCAVLEFTLQGPKLLCHAASMIAITGADSSPKLNEEVISNDKLIYVKKGDVISFGKLIKGMRGYIAFHGGLHSEVVLGSRSQFNHVTKKMRLEKGDLIKFKETNLKMYSSKAYIANKKQFYETDCLEVYKGPEYDLFAKKDLANFFNQLLTVSNDNNRMGYRLNESMVSHNKSLITSPVLPGTVQLLPSGKIIILMRDAQTTGGYPRVFQLSELAISILSQKKAGDKMHLKLID